MYFGSGIMTDTGIILNDEMADFNIPGADTVSGVGDPKVCWFNSRPDQFKINRFEFEFIEVILT